MRERDSPAVEPGEGHMGNVGSIALTWPSAEEWNMTGRVSVPKQTTPQPGCGVVECSFSYCVNNDSATTAARGQACDAKKRERAGRRDANPNRDGVLNVAIDQGIHVFARSHSQ